MKKPVIARQRVTVTHENPVENPGSEMAGAVETWTESFFVYEGESGVDLVGKTVAAGEDHHFVQEATGLLTPHGAEQVHLLMSVLGWDNRELGQRAGVNAGAVRDAVMRTASCTNTYPKMLQALRIGLDAKARLDAAKQKAAA